MPLASPCQIELEEAIKGIRKPFVRDLSCQCGDLTQFAGYAAGLAGKLIQAPSMLI
jgi:hypothetical protein